MESILYQKDFLAVTNEAKNDVKYISNVDISKMQGEHIITINSHYVVNGTLNPNEDIAIITEGYDNSFFCIFVRTIGNVMELKPKRKLTQTEVKRYKKIWQQKTKG